jgi:hypothetical protein
MSKAIRIREHLYNEIEKLAKEERRSLIGQLEYLLEQALRLNDSPTQANNPGPNVTTTFSPPSADPHFKPDFK